MTWLKRFFSRNRRYDDLAVSIQEHLDERTEELMEDGMSREEAAQKARREFGNVTQIAERSREAWQWPTLESIWADVRFALHQLRKSPGFAITAILTLALGIGATTAIFSVVKAVLLASLPYKDSSRLVAVWTANDLRDGKPHPSTAADFLIWKGFGEFQTLGITKTRPIMIGVQADGAAPIAKAVKRKRDRIEPVTNPRTIASAIRIGSPVNWTKVLRAINESHGTAETVSDKEILEAQRDLASKEGIFVEPASAASIAGLRKSREAGRIDRSDLVVCVTTGHGLKDPSVVDYLPKHEGYTLKVTQPDWIERLERTL